mgnify:CR=1 FL=1
MNTEYMVYCDIDCHHQDKLVACISFGGEDGIYIVASTEIAAHLSDGTVFADFDDTFVIAGQGAQYLAVDTGVVVFGIDEFTHGYNLLGLFRAL